MKRNKAFRRHQSRRSISRKMYIAKHVFHSDMYWKKKKGKLDKGKVHCSCPICSRKTEVHGIKHSIKKQLLKYDDEILV